MTSGSTDTSFGDPVSLVRRPAWAALEAHRRNAGPLRLRALFEEDPARTRRFSLERLGIYFDGSSGLSVGKS
jgi:hypothetical protein